MPLTLSSKGPSASELERLRLALSVFQDGSGWESIKKTKKQGSERIYYAGYRQFERIVADVFGGVAPENKGVFDVFVPLSGTDMHFGVSCKMRGELNNALKDNGTVYIEMSNAAGKFMDKVKQEVGKNFQKYPNDVGQTLLSLISGWHNNVAKNTGYKINLAESSFLVLLYTKQLTFRLYQYELPLPEATNFTWTFPQPKSKLTKDSRRLVGYHKDKVVFEWYLYSGGQLKYY
ncbi:MAG: hypothetical protein ABI621_05990, partial [Chloroflexota bacterium]